MSDPERIDEPAKTLQEYVEQRIRDIFDEVARRVSDLELTEDEAAGVPLGLWKAENHMIRAWHEYVAGSLDDVA